MLDLGRRALSDAELLAVLIGTGNPIFNALDVCRKILKEADNNIHVLAGYSVDDFCRYYGMGPAKALRIIAALELGRRREKTKFEEKPLMDTSKKVYNYLKPIYMDLKHEEAWVIYLNTSGRVIRKEMIGKGGTDFTPVDVKAILRLGIECQSRSIILSHNHPSGCLKASKADIYMTDRVSTACSIFDIQVFDHIIFTNEGYFSFQDEGFLE